MKRDHIGTLEQLFEPDWCYAIVCIKIREVENVVSKEGTIPGLE